MHGIGIDLRAALRGLRARPGLHLFLALTLAVGLAAAGAIFGVVDALVLRPLAFKGMDELVMAWETAPNGDEFDRWTTSPADFLDWRDASGGAFRQLVALDWWETAITGRDVPEQVVGIRVSPGFFEMLGAAPLQGRYFVAEDFRGDSRRLVLGHDLWQRRFGGAAGLVGSAVSVGGVPYTVVGIAPRGFGFPSGAEAWAPLALGGDAPRDEHSLAVMGRLAPGVSREAAAARLAVVAASLEREHPATNASRGVRLVGLSEGMEDPGSRPVLLIWQAAALFLLLIACVNVANLVLVRGSERRTELAVRLALGAGPWRVVRQLAVEGLLLALCAVLAALPLCWLASRELRERMPARIARYVTGWETIGVDGRSLLFMAALALLSVVLFSAWPALRAARPEPAVALSEGRRGSGVGGGRQRGRSALVVAEVAAALMLLAAAAMSVQGALRMLRGPLGFDPDGVLTFEVRVPARDSAPEARRALARDLRGRLEALPGVTAVALANVLPCSGGNTTETLALEGETEPDPAHARSADARFVSPEYHAVMRVPILSGRGLDARDDADAPRVAVVSRSMARSFWPGRDPLGRRFRAGGPDAPWLTVVGVSGDVVHQWFNRRNFPTFYAPWAQGPTRSLHFALRVAGDPEALSPAVRRAVSAADPDLPADDVFSMRRAVGHSTIGLQYGAAIMSSFGGLALLLAVSGVYGVMAYRVSLRRRELGVRIALGASARDILRLTLGQGLTLSGLGLVLGLGLALALGRAMASAFQGAVAPEPSSLAGALGLLCLATLVAALLPARRALRLDPARVLREE